MMPGLDGLEMTRQLRQLANHRTTPVVFVTALSDFEVRARSLLCGGCDFIAKPIIPTELVVKAFSFALRHRVVLEMAARASGNANVTEPEPVERHLGVLHVDASNRIRRGNKDIPGLLGLDPTELVGKAVTEVFPDDVQEPGVGEKVEELLCRGAAKSSATLRAKGKDGAIIQVLATCRDTTQGGEKIRLLLLRNVNSPKSEKVNTGCGVADNPGARTTKPEVDGLGQYQVSAESQVRDGKGAPQSATEPEAEIPNDPEELKREVKRLRGELNVMVRKEAEAVQCWEQAQAALDKESARRLELEISLKKARELEMGLRKQLEDKDLQRFTQFSKS
jgi:CheY-like chemotaxis protein